MARKKIKPLSKVEVDIVMCRLQGALYEKDTERIDKILGEVRARVKELKEAGLWRNDS